MAEVYRHTVIARSRGLLAVAVSLGIALTAGAVSWLGTGNPAVLGFYAYVYFLVVAAGMIGLDVHRGSVHLMLARPLTRTDYTLGRLCGVLTLGCAFAALLYAQAFLCATAGGHSPSGVEFAVALAETELDLLWMGALVYLFSCIVPERGDVLAYFGTVAVTSGLGVVAGNTDDPRIAAVAYAAAINLRNDVILTGLQAAELPVADLLRWSANVALAVSLGTWIFNRRQFSYGAA